MKRILLLGKNGQVGWELQRSLAPLAQVIALDASGADGLSGDLTDLDGLADTVRRVAPDAIVNAAAYTAVDQAETEPDLARLINTEAPGVLAREAASCGAWLVHYSTDYVFDGNASRPWQETDATAPLSVYGTTKRDGDAAVSSSGARAFIFRTSWVYGRRGSNFIRTMLRLATERDYLQVIDDQIGAPTSAELIADITALALYRVLHADDPACYAGLYNLAAWGETSWYDYARFVLRYARYKGVPLKVNEDQIRAIATIDYPSAAQRPLYSLLDTSRLCNTFCVALPHWQCGVQRLLDEIL